IRYVKSTASKTSKTMSTAPRSVLVFELRNSCFDEDDPGGLPLKAKTDIERSALALLRPYRYQRAAATATSSLAAVLLLRFALHDLLGFLVDLHRSFELK